MPSIQELVPAFKNHAKSMGIRIRGSELQSALVTFIDFTLTVLIKSALPADADGNTLLFKSGIETNLPDNYNELYTNGKWPPDEEANCTRAYLSITRHVTSKWNQKHGLELKYIYKKGVTIPESTFWIVGTDPEDLLQQIVDSDAFRIAIQAKVAKVTTQVHASE